MSGIAPSARTYIIEIQYRTQKLLVFCTIADTKTEIFLCIIEIVYLFSQTIHNDFYPVFRFFLLNLKHYLYSK